MSITKEIIDTCYIHAQHTGNAPYTLRICEELWKEIEGEMENSLIPMENTKEDLQFNGMAVTIVNSGEFFRFAIQ